MDEEARNIARRAAGRLEGEFGPALPALVERELQAPGSGPQRYMGVETAIALAGLLVSIAQFAWQAYRDLKKDRTEPSPEALARQIRLRVELQPQVAPAQRDRLVGIVVEEVLAPASKL
jgi:hypothetical protein